MTRVSKRVVVVNSIGTLGYMVGFVAWTLFLAAVAAYFLSGVPLVPPPPAPTHPPTFVQEANGLAVVFSYILAVVGVIITAGVLVTAPYFISKWASKWLHRCMKAVKITPSLALLWLTKVVSLSLPGLGVLVIMALVGNPSSVLVTLSVLVLGMSVVAMLLFAAQHLIAAWLRVTVDKVW